MLSNTIKGTIIVSVRSVISFRLSHSTSKITDEELRRGVVCSRAVRWGKGKKKIFLLKIFMPKIFLLKIFLTKIFTPKVFLPEMHTPKPFLL